MTVDHFVPLCLGGPDAVANLWWEDRARAEWKDEIELRACRAMRRVERSGNDPHSRRAVVDQYLRAVEAMGGEERARAESLLQATSEAPAGYYQYQPPASPFKQQQPPATPFSPQQSTVPPPRSYWLAPDTSSAFPPTTYTQCSTNAFTGVTSCTSTTY